MEKELKRAKAHVKIHIVILTANYRKVNREKERVIKFIRDTDIEHS